MPRAIAIMNQLAAIPGSYGNTFFIKLVWEYPDIDDSQFTPSGDGPFAMIQYFVERKEANEDDVAFINIGTVLGFDTVFYDVAATRTDITTSVKANTSYTYRVKAYYNGVDLTDEITYPDYPVPRVTINSPDFPTYGIITDKGSDPEDPWIIKCGLSIDNTSDNMGRPSIIVVNEGGKYHNSDFHATPSIHNIVVQISEEGKAWIIASEITKDTHETLVAWSDDLENDTRLPHEKFAGVGWVLFVSPPDNVLEYNTTYRVRLATKRISDGLITHYSNTVVITTYSNDEKSFPNMWPNAGLQYGFYDNNENHGANFTHTGRLPTAKDGAKGTYSTYKNLNSSYPTLPAEVGRIYPSPITTVSGSEATFYSGKAMRMSARDDWFNQPAIINLAAYNFPLNPFSEARNFAILCRTVEDWYDYGEYFIIEDGLVDLGGGFWTMYNGERIAQRRDIGQPFIPAPEKPAKFGFAFRNTSTATGTITFRLRSTTGDVIILEKLLVEDVRFIPSDVFKWYYCEFSYALDVCDTCRLCVEFAGTGGIEVAIRLDVKPNEYISSYSGAWADNVDRDLNYYYSYYDSVNTYRFLKSTLGVSQSPGLSLNAFEEVISTSTESRPVDEQNTLANEGPATLLANTFGIGESDIISTTCPCSYSTFVNSANPTNSQNGLITTYIDWDSGTSQATRTYLKFNLSSIPSNATIISAAITLECGGKYTDSATLPVQKPGAPGPGWDGNLSTLTWNKQPTLTDEPSATFKVGFLGPGATSGNLKDTLQEYIQNGTNYGWAFMARESGGTNGGYYRGRDYDGPPYYPGDPSPVPTLWVTYTVVPSLYQIRTKLRITTPTSIPITSFVFSNVYVGDFMLLDLTRIFGGNGIDIYDNSSMITGTQIKKVIDNSLNSWWDFDYARNIEPIPFDITPVVDGTKITFENLCTPYDDLGGMDTTGCLPMAGYAIQYKKMGTSYYDEKSLPVACGNIKHTGIHFDGDTFVTNPYIGNVDPDAGDALSTDSPYQLRYVYSNSSGNVGYSDPAYATTYAYPSKVLSVSMKRFYSVQNHDSYFSITWDASTASVEFPIIDYVIELAKENSEGEIDWGGAGSIIRDTPIGGNLSLQRNIQVLPNTVYFCRIRAYSSLGYGAYSDIVSEVSVSLPSAPMHASYYFTNIAGDSTDVIYSWEAPQDSGCTEDGTEGIIKYIIMHGLDPTNLTTSESGSYVFQPNYSLDKDGSSYFKVAAVTNYTNYEIAVDEPGVFTDLKKVTFMTYTEIVKLRGTATTEGYVDFYFTARTGDGTYIQLTDNVEGNEKEAFWRLTDHGRPISVNANVITLMSLINEEILNPSTNVFRNGIVLPGEGYSPGWPLSTDGAGPAYSVSSEEDYDLFGQALKIIFTMQQYDEYEWDVHASTAATPTSTTSIGLDGIGVFMVMTDYTTDINFYSENTTAVREFYDFITGVTGSLVWTINASVVYNPYLNTNENTPLVSKEFYIPVVANDTMDNLVAKVLNEDTGLAAQINGYFLGNDIAPAIREIYYSADQNHPFVVSAESIPATSSADNKAHMKVTIRTMVERVLNQITCRTFNLKAFYVATRANTYYLNDMMYELRSFDDMYGRNKPGTPFTGKYVKRSYGFKFNLDYIKDYSEDENATIDLTPIPGTSSSNAIGLDIQGTMRTVNISGTRVDNSNYWMFHAPFEYIDDVSSSPTYGEVVQGGVIYMGTSNWGWSKFMKAVMGTFQFIDGPYRLIIMTIPSSLMQQYVPSRYCKYQYPDGTYIIQAGLEDMCYVLIERFTTRKNDEQFNAIDYELVLRRAVPLGSST